MHAFTETGEKNTRSHTHQHTYTEREPERERYIKRDKESGKRKEIYREGELTVDGLRGGSETTRQRRCRCDPVVGVLLGGGGGHGGGCCARVRQSCSRERGGSRRSGSGSSVGGRSMSELCG